MSKQELNTLVDRLISIKDSHKSEIYLSEVETINRACNCLEVILSREKSGDRAKAVGYICKNCFPDFEKGFEPHGDTDE